MYFMALSIIFTPFFYFSNGQLLSGHKHLAKQFKKVAESLNVSTIETKWIEQPTDHFNVTDSRTWSMKYYENLDRWKTGGPIYIYIGGEEPAISECLINGLMYDLSVETNGAMFSLEHRYYGDSKPFGNVTLTAQNLQYLSARQALADVAQFIREKKLSASFISSQVIVVGGSYSGNLAAWMRLCYSELVDAAISSSAPLLAKVNFFEYLDAVGTDFSNQGSEHCIDQINSILDGFLNLLQNESGIEQLKEQQNICNETDMHILENQQMFFLYVVYPFTSEAQDGDPERIKNLCNSLNFTDNSPIVEQDCRDCDFNHLTASLDVPWRYQLCTEFGYFQTSPQSQPFSRLFDLNLFYQICLTLFGPEFDATRTEEGVTKINEFYGGLNPNVTNVVFVNGELDPWSRLGILRNLSDTAPAIVIPGVSHCKDLFYFPDDSEQLKEARRGIKSIIKQWIGQTSL